MFSLTFKSTFIFLLLLAFVGQVTASAVMSCELSNASKQQVTSDNDKQHTMHMSNYSADKVSKSSMNHDCCADDVSENSEHCGGNCQCVIGSCSLVYVEVIKALNGDFTPAEQVLPKLTPSPRTQFLSFLFRPPIV